MLTFFFFVLQKGFFKPLHLSIYITQKQNLTIYSVFDHTRLMHRNFNINNLLYITLRQIYLVGKKYIPKIFQKYLFSKPVYDINNNFHISLSFFSVFFILIDYWSLSLLLPLFVVVNNTCMCNDWPQLDTYGHLNGSDGSSVANCGRWQ